MGYGYIDTACPYIQNIILYCSYMQQKVQVRVQVAVFSSVDVMIPYMSYKGTYVSIL